MLQPLAAVADKREVISKLHTSHSPLAAHDVPFANSAIYYIKLMAGWSACYVYHEEEFKVAVKVTITLDHNTRRDPYLSALR